jgi:hypothetical protein
MNGKVEEAVDRVVADVEGAPLGKAVDPVKARLGNARQRRDHRRQPIHLRRARGFRDTRHDFARRHLRS